MIRILSRVAPHTTSPDPRRDTRTRIDALPTRDAAPASGSSTGEPPQAAPSDRGGVVTEAPPEGFSNAAVRVADLVAARIRDGSWDGDRFPTLMEMKAELSCGLHTLCDAMRLLRQRGLVHKVGLLRSNGRGKVQVWRPVSVAGHSRRQFEDDVRQGRLQGVLPSPYEMAESYRVAASAMAAQYQELVARGLIGLVWSPDLRSRQWRVLDERTRTWPTQPTKALALAAELVRRMPEWLQRRNDGTWYRCVLPEQQELKRQYHTHVLTVEHAHELLVALNVLERAPLVRPVYLPRPPADGGQSYGVTFTRSNGLPGRGWRPAGPAAQWLPLPQSEDDEIVATAKGRRRRAPRAE